MDKNMLDKLIQMISSENDTDAIMGLRGLQGYVRDQGVDFADAVAHMAATLHDVKKAATTFEHVMTPVQAAPAAKAPSVPSSKGGMPDCTAAQGELHISVPGKSEIEKVILPGASAADGAMIAANLKDAMVAAVINSSKMKLRLSDIKNGRGETVETALQAVYEREGMTPVQVWSNVKGEVASLAAVLRKAVANIAPELMAA